MVKEHGDAQVVEAQAFFKAAEICLNAEDFHKQELFEQVLECIAVSREGQSAAVSMTKFTLLLDVLGLECIKEAQSRRQASQTRS